jgi:subtilisin family serine protease
MHVRFVLFIALLPLVAAAAPATDDRHTYMVRLQGQSLVEHVHARVASQNLAAAEGGEKPAMRRELRSSLAQDYLQQLDAARTRVLDAGSAELGRTLTPRTVYRYAGNGMALSLTDAEATHLATLPGVLGVRRERILHPLTDAGPEWIGADKLWNGQVAGVATTKGEGVVIGIIDTGISPTHPSFAATGPDGYTIANPRGHFYGLCASAQATCNNKLIGIYDFTDEGTKGIDSVGHGTHVAGIAAGNGMNNALKGTTVSLPRFVSGVAPHANIIMYKACKSGTSGGTCPESDLVGALDQAIADNVDVINYSIGGDAQDAWQLLAQGNTDAAAMFDARAAGIVVVAAAGNEGPGPNSLGEPGNVPWVIGVANATHDREFANSIGGFSGASNAPPTLTGAGYTSGYGPVEIVYAGNYGNALCGTGPTDYPPTGKSNPFPPGTFNGQIVICDRGIYARVEKGYNVKLGGAGGYILANAQSDGESIVSDDHYLPAVHLGYTEGAALKAWVASSGSHQGTISGVSALLQASLGDILNSSSSRGPYGFGGGILKPDITAPGTNILSSDYQSNGLAFMTGTSMASPNVTGAAALLVAAHPTWGPAQIESALLGTALAGSVRLQDGVTPASPLDAGTGRVQPAAAAQTGLYLPLSTADFRAQDPSHGGNPAALNRPGIESESCFGQCSFVRTVTDMSGGGAWTVSVQGATANAKITATPTQFSLAAGASQKLNIAVDVSDPHLTGTWSNARIVLHKSGGGQAATDFALTLAVYASPGKAQAFREFTTDKPFFDTTLDISGLAALPHAQFALAGLVTAKSSPMSLGVDPKPNELYTTFPGTGKQFVLFPVLTPSGFSSPPPGGPQGRVFIVEIAASTSPSATLYAGIDSNGNGQPDFAEQACAAQGVGARCIVDLRDQPASAQVWALVDIPSGSTGATYNVTLSSGLPDTPPGFVNQGSIIHGAIAGPGHVASGANFPLRMTLGSVINWLAPGRYYGAVMIDALPISGSMAGRVGVLPFALARAPGGDDVVDPLTLGTDAMRQYAIAAGESLRHLFVDIPDTRQITILTGPPIDSPFGRPPAANAAFYLARSDMPPSARSAQIAAAPPVAAAVKQWSIGGAGPAQATVSATVGPGRWYIVATNVGSSDGQFTLSLANGTVGTAAPPTPGAYYNPERSGHGIFISQATGQQVVYWYTFNEDGTPTWYAAQADAPASGAVAWSAPLFSVNWDGAQVNSYSVLGDMILTPIDANNLEFSWHLHGDAGSEHFTRIGAGASCVDLGSGQANLNGQWYAPTQSGYGMDVFALPGFQQDTFYLYDALGMPRWIAGSANSTAGSNTMPMYQIGGFCPLCDWVATQPVQVGTMTTNFTSGTQGHYATQLQLVPPLSGSWSINQSIVRLSGSPTCP